MDIRIDLNEPQIVNKVASDKFGLLVSREWKRLIDKYTPRETGMLESNVTELPFKLHYKEPYAHYMYTGIVYVDPIYKVGGFYDAMFGWWSRPGVDKIPSDKKLTYSKNPNPFATDHWDVKAVETGQREKLYRILNNALQSGRI